MVKIAREQGPNIDAGRYRLKIGDSMMMQVPNYNDKDVMDDKVKITFTIVSDDEWDGTEFSDLFYMSDSKKSKLGQLARAAFRTEDLPPEWDTLDLTGKRVEANVQRNDNGYNSLVKDTINAPKVKAKPEEKAEPKAAEVDDTWDEDSDVA